jgi:secreted PhoX family phosphatase
MLHRDLRPGGAALLAIGATLALVAGPVAAQDDPYGIGTPVAASGTGVTGAPALEAIELASGLKATLVSDAIAEVPDMIGLLPYGAAQPTHAVICNEIDPAETPQASVQLVDLATGAATDMLSGMISCDPVKSTAWGTVLVGEEESDGRIIEILDPMTTTGITYDRAAGTTSDPTKAAVRTALGQLAYEGVVVQPDGTVYYADERRPSKGQPGGGIYKFVPTTAFAGTEAITDLAQSPLSAGSVWVMRLGLRASDDVPAQDYGQGSNSGAGVWVPLTTPADPTTFGLYDAGIAAGMTGFYRPEDMALDPKADGVRVCWNNTGNDAQQNWGETLCLTDVPAEDATVHPAGTMPAVQPFVIGTADLRMPDNLDFDPTTGNLWINMDATTSADNPDNGNDDVWVCLPDGDDMDTLTDGCARALTLLDGGAEFSGITWLPDGSGFLQHLQHRTQDGDATPGTSDLILVTLAE